MQLKLFVLPIKNLGAAEAEMNAFLRGHRVLAVKKEFVADGENSFWTFCYFTIHDPKERTICAANFRERVMHHALMNVCEPALERAAIFDSYACRQGKGQLAAVQRAESYARRYGWFLKLDVRKYFDSIDHAVLRGLLREKFKDVVVLALFDQVLASYQTAPGRGLPIGNLTAQPVFVSD